MDLPEPSSYQAIGWLVATAAAAIAAINQGHAFVGRITGKENERTISPNPLTVRGEKEYVTKEEFEAAFSEVKDDYARIQASLVELDKGLRSELKNDASAIHEKINGVAISVARVESSDHEKSRLIQQLHDDIRVLISRITK